MPIRPWACRTAAPVRMTEQAVTWEVAGETSRGVGRRPGCAGDPRAKPDHGRLRRRSERHRHLFAGQQPVRLRTSVDCPLHVSPDGRDPGNRARESRRNRSAIAIGVELPTRGLVKARRQLRIGSRLMRWTIATRMQAPISEMTNDGRGGGDSREQRAGSCQTRDGVLWDSYGRGPWLRLHHRPRRRERASIRPQSCRLSPLSAASHPQAELVHPLPQAAFRREVRISVTLTDRLAGAVRSVTRSSGGRRQPPSLALLPAPNPGGGSGPDPDPPMKLRRGPVRACPGRGRSLPRRPPGPARQPPTGAS